MIELAKTSELKIAHTEGQGLHLQHLCRVAAAAVAFILFAAAGDSEVCGGGVPMTGFC